MCISFSLDGPVQNCPETTNLLTSEKFKEDPTAEMFQMNYNYGHTPFNRLQSMATNSVLPKTLDGFPFPIYTSCL